MVRGYRVRESSSLTNDDESTDGMKEDSNGDAKSGKMVALSAKAKVALVVIGILVVAAAIIAAVLATRDTSTTETCPGLSPGDCSSMFSKSLQFVAFDCEHDVGICPGESCGNCGECCGPVFEETSETCGGERVVFSRVTGCNCVSCDNFALAVSGRVIGDCSKNISCAMSIRVNETEVTKSNTDGFFTFPTTHPSNERIVITVVDTAGLYNDKKKLVEVSRSSQSYVNVEISVSLKPAPIKFNASNGTTLNLGESKSVTLVVPPNSTYDANEELYEGEVDLVLSFVDTSLDNATQDINGELSVMVDGELTPLISYGMLDMSISAGNTSLTANGVTVELSEDAISNATSGNVSLWPFDSDTALWGSPEPLQRAVDTRTRKRRSARNTNTVLKATVNLSSIRRIYNLDALVGSYCYMKVRIFNDENNEEYNQNLGVKITSIYRRAGGGWSNYIERRSWRHGACLNVPCSRQGWAEVDKVYIFINGYYSYDPYQVTDDLKEMVSYRENMGAIEITIPRWGSNIPTSYNGPFYSKYDWRRCRSYSSFERESYFRFIRRLTGSTTTAANMNATTVNMNVTAVNVNATTVNMNVTAVNMNATTVSMNVTATNMNPTTSDGMDGSGSDVTTTTNDSFVG